MAKFNLLSSVNIPILCDATLWIFRSLLAPVEINTAFILMNHQPQDAYVLSNQRLIDKNGNLPF